MMKPSPKIVFFGSGPVAAESLELILGSFEVEAVVTKANPAHHRGRAPVIDLCEHKNLNYVTPADKAGLKELFATRPFQSTAGIVVDYGVIIPGEVIDYFTFGITNSHFSLLPQWRGADPITFSILSGQAETGVSLMLINEALDEGLLLAQEIIVVQADDTSESLTHKLVRLSGSMLAEHLPKYIDGKIEPYPQTGEPTYSRKLTKQDGRLDWNKPAEVLEREIRAYHSWPKSTGKVGIQELIVREADVVKTSGKAGDFAATKKELVIYCGQDALSLKRVQPVNKKEMPIQAFLAGYTL